jgi:hypothetical protein
MRGGGVYASLNHASLSEASMTAIAIMVIWLGSTGVCVYAFTRVLQAILRWLER